MQPRSATAPAEPHGPLPILVILESMGFGVTAVKDPLSRDPQSSQKCTELGWAAGHGASPALLLGGSGPEWAGMLMGLFGSRSDSAPCPPWDSHGRPVEGPGS